MAMSIILHIFRACVSDNDPPKTVKSCENTYIMRPLIVPQPVTTPSPAGLWSAIPKSSQRWTTNISNSSKDPSSNKISTRSLAVNLPFACCASIRFLPPPNRASALLFSSSVKISFIIFLARVHAANLAIKLIIGY